MLSFLIFCWSLSALCLVLMVKAEVDYKHYLKIADAIVYYGTDTEQFDEALEMFDHIRPYCRTVFRVWDWGYKNILPKEDFELIKPYLEVWKGRNRCF